MRLSACQFGMDGLVYGVPPARKRAGDEGDEKNSIMSMVLQVVKMSI